MTISKRLTRAGLAFTVFGLCASLLPNSATAITGADACTTGGGLSNIGTSGRGIKSSVVDTDVAVGVVAGLGLGYLASTSTHSTGAATASSLPTTHIKKPAVSETAQRQQIQQLKGFAYNGQ